MSGETLVNYAIPRLIASPVQLTSPSGELFINKPWLFADNSSEQNIKYTRIPVDMFWMKAFYCVVYFYLLNPTRYIPTMEGNMLAESLFWIVLHEPK